jgi:hypothetical protein
MSVQSQDVYAAPGVTISAVGAGGGGSVPPNPEVSTISALGLLNVSSINGVAYTGPGGLPANLVVSSISTLALSNLSSINGVAYTGSGTIPANLTVSSISTLALSNVSSINGAAYVAGGVPANLTVSSISTLALSNVSSINGVAYTQGGGVPENLVVSTIIASTVNGAAPPRSLGGYNLIVPAFSSFQNAGIFPFNSPCIQFSTVAGHSYLLDYVTSIAPTQPSLNPALIPLESEMSFAVNSGATSIRGTSLPTQSVYYISQGPFSSFNNTASIPFTAASSGASFVFSYVNNNVANEINFTNSTIVSSMANVILTDLGVL